MTVLKFLYIWALLAMTVTNSLSFSPIATRLNHKPVVSVRQIYPSSLDAGKQTGERKDDLVDLPRRQVWKKTVVKMTSAVLGAAALLSISRPAWAFKKSRNDGYDVQKSEAEWKSILSPIQYNILREGGTERPGYSILEKEKRPGTFKCAGCGTVLFSSVDKFNSGTGWPSFARGLEGVEIEKVDPVTANLSGAELRCKTCGGHLGDVFRDGYLFQGTPAAATGQRFCIDGAALVFFSDDDEGSPAVRGDVPARKKEPSTMPSFLDGPKITPRDRV